MSLQKTRLSGIITLLLVIALSQIKSLAQSDKARYFDETGHWVTDTFLEMYNSVQYPELLYGLPITDAFDSRGAVGSPEVRVQYFERARFEYRSNSSSTLPISISPLGVYLYDYRTPGETIITQPGLAACKYFSQTNHQVCYAFLDFFEQYGGIVQFGYPISEVEVQDGRMVQYFQRSRFEWHPEQASGERVVLTDVGRIFFDMTENPQYLRPGENNGDYIPKTILALNVQAFVETAVIGEKEQQTLYVAVQDQNYQPVQNAQVTFALSLPNEDASFLMPATNDVGITNLDFSVLGQPTGIVQITVTANYNDLEGQTITSYRVWW